MSRSSAGFPSFARDVQFSRSNTNAQVEPLVPPQALQCRSHGSLAEAGLAEEQHGLGFAGFALPGAVSTRCESVHYSGSAGLCNTLRGGLRDTDWQGLPWPSPTNFDFLVSRARARVRLKKTQHVRHGEALLREISRRTRLRGARASVCLDVLK
jgi:hypothetical protein